MATEWTDIAAGAPTIQTGTVHSGTYAMQCNPAVTTCAEFRDISSITSGTLYGRVFFRAATLPNAVVSLVATSSNTAAWALQVQYVNTSGVIRLRNAITTTTTDGTTVLSTGQWYRIEFRQLVAETGGEMEARLYADMGTTALDTLTITNEDTLPSDIRRLYVGAFNSSNTSTVFIDDIAVNNSSGTFQASWPGPGKIAMVKPASNVAVAWATNGTCAGGNYDCIDDEPGAPNDTNYTSDATTSNVDQMAVTALPAEVPSDAVIGVCNVNARTGAASTGISTGELRLWDQAASLTSGPSIDWNVGASTWVILGVASQLVFDAGARTKADIASFNIGYKGLTGTTNARWVSAQWMNVEWQPAAGASASTTLSGGINLSGGATFQ